MYNNFQSKKKFSCPGLQPILEEVTNADFSDIEKVFEIENNKPLKIAHKLNKAVINPKSVEKTSVKLAMAVFHETTINALIEYGFLDTANVLRVFMKLWNVLNVKTTSIGKFKRDITRDPVQSTDDWKLKYLDDMATFFELWQSFGILGLTKETFLAFQQTCRAISSLARYLIDDCGFN